MSRSPAVGLIRIGAIFVARVPVRNVPTRAGLEVDAAHTAAISIDDDADGTIGLCRTAIHFQ